MSNSQDVNTEFKDVLQELRRDSQNYPGPLKFAADCLFSEKTLRDITLYDFWGNCTDFLEIYFRFVNVFLLTLHDDNGHDVFAHKIKIEKPTLSPLRDNCIFLYEQLSIAKKEAIHFTYFKNPKRVDELIKPRNDHAHPVTVPEIGIIKDFLKNCLKLIDETKLTEVSFLPDNREFIIGDETYFRGKLLLEKDEFNIFPTFILYKKDSKNELDEILLYRGSNELRGLKERAKCVKVNTTNFRELDNHKGLTQKESMVYEKIFKAKTVPSHSRQEKGKKQKSEQDKVNSLKKLSTFRKFASYCIKQIFLFFQLKQKTEEPIESDRSNELIVAEDHLCIKRWKCKLKDEGAAYLISSLNNICREHRDNISKPLEYYPKEKKYLFERREGITVSTLIDILNRIYNRKNWWRKHNKLIISITIAFVSVLFALPVVMIITNLLLPDIHYAINVSIISSAMIITILVATLLVFRLNNNTNFKLSRLTLDDIEKAIMKHNHGQKNNTNDFNDDEDVNQANTESEHTSDESNTRRYRKASMHSPAEITILRQYGKLLDMFRSINQNKYSITGINAENILFDPVNHNFFLYPLFPAKNIYEKITLNDEENETGHLKPLADILGKLLTLDKNYQPRPKKPRVLFNNKLAENLFRAINNKISLPDFLKAIEDVRDKITIDIYSKRNLKIAIMFLFIIPVITFLIFVFDSYRTQKKVENIFIQQKDHLISDSLKKHRLDAETWQKFFHQKNDGFLKTAKNFIQTKSGGDLVPVYYINYFRFPEKRMASIADKFFNRGLYDDAAQYYDLILQYNSVDDDRKLQEIQKWDWAPNRAICYHRAGAIEKAHKIFEPFDDKMLNPHQKYIKKIVAGQINKDIESLCAEAEKYYAEKNWRGCLDLCSAIIKRYSNSDRSGEEINYNSWIQAHLYSAESKYRIDKQKGQYDPAELLYRVRNHILRAHEIAASARGLKKPLDYRSIQEDIHTTELNIYLHIFRDTLEQNPEKGLEIFKEVYTKSVPEQEQKGVFKTIIDYVDAKNRIENELSKSRNSHTKLSNKIVSLNTQLEETANTLSSDRQALKTQIENLKAELSQKDDLEKIVHRMLEIEGNIITQLKGEHSGLGETLNRSFRQSIKDIQASIDQWRAQYSKPQPAETSAE